MIKAKKIVLFDIDHTIFNTESYRKKLYKNLAEELEITENHHEIVHSKYRQVKDDFGYFVPVEFLEALLKISKKNTDIKILKRIFHDSFLYTNSLFPDVIKTLIELMEMKVTIGIFSTGESAFQRIKIEAIKKYLKEDHIHIATDKFNIMTNTFSKYKNYQIFLVDDFPKVLIDAKNHNKEIFTVFMKRKESYPGLVIPETFLPDITITNLDQLTDIIRTNN